MRFTGRARVVSHRCAVRTLARTCAATSFQPCRVPAPGRGSLMTCMTVEGSAPRQELTSGNAKLDAGLKLPREWQMQLSTVYLAADLLPQGRIGSRFSLDAGLKKSVNRGRGEFVVNATDLLNTNHAERTIRGTDFTLVSTDYLETQVVRVGYSWKF